jgi:hypothetical protein
LAVVRADLRERLAIARRVRESGTGALWSRPRPACRPLLVREERIPYAAGAAALAGLEELAAARGWPPPSSSIAFFDTETTGLCGGTGTVVFLAGWARLSADGLELTQVALGDLGEEAELLDRVIPALAQGVVTYNGACFDLPLLETRAVLQRLAWERRHIPAHFDLLHPVRRFLRGQLTRCALTAVEAELLGRRRDADIPGWAIPAAFYGHVDGDERALEPVLAHHRADILALVDVAALLGGHLRGGCPFPDARGELARARHLLCLGRVPQSVAAARRAFVCARGPDVGFVGLHLARILERAAGDRHAALAVVEEALSREALAVSRSNRILLERRRRRLQSQIERKAPPTRLE